MVNGRSGGGASPEPANSELQRILGGPLAALDHLDDKAQGELLDAIRAVRKHQRQTLAAAMEGALAFVPALMRGPLRKLFGG